MIRPVDIVARYRRDAAVRAIFKQARLLRKHAVHSTKWPVWSFR